MNELGIKLSIQTLTIIQMYNLRLDETKKIQRNLCDLIDQPLQKQHLVCQ